MNCNILFDIFDIIYDSTVAICNMIQYIKNKFSRITKNAIDNAIRE